MAYALMFGASYSAINFSNKSLSEYNQCNRQIYLINSYNLTDKMVAYLFAFVCNKLVIFTLGASVCGLSPYALG